MAKNFLLIILTQNDYNFLSVLNGSLNTKNFGCVKAYQSFFGRKKYFMRIKLGSYQIRVEHFLKCLLNYLLN